MRRKPLVTRNNLLLRGIFLSLGIAILVQPSVLKAQFADNCQEPSPGFSVSECVSSTGAPQSCSSLGSIRLWSDVFEPADSGQLPARRDSTIWRGLTRPETDSNDELFTGIAIVEDKAYVSYVNGFSVWELNCGTLGTGTCPSRITSREVFENDWFHDDAGGEIYLLTWSIDAIKFGNKVYVAIPGDTGEIGLSIWDVTSSNSPQQIYQDWGRDGFEARLAEIDGRLYVFYASEDSANAGVHVYDVSALGSGSCFEDTTASTSCGVYKGAIGAYPRSSYLDIHQPDGPNGETFLVHSRNSTSEGFQILEIINPTTSPPIAQQKVIEDFPGTRVRGVALFEKGGNDYVAANVGTEINIYHVSSCLQSSCGSLPNPVFSVPNVSSSRVFLTHSESVVDNVTTPFLYIGGSGRCLSGSRKEQLFDLSALNPVAPNPGVYEVTDGIVQGGNTYIDPENGLQVDYWGNYYSKNSHGFSNVGPRYGVFYKQYFLRTATTLFDIHKFTPNDLGGAPNVSLAAPGGTHFFTENVVLTATSTNCSGTDWEWANDGPGCSGQVLLSNETTSTYSVSCPHPTGCTPPCSSWQVDVEVQKTCSGDNVADDQTVNFVDGRPVINEILLPAANPPNQYPVCTVLDIGASVAGSNNNRTFNWALLFPDGEPVLDPDTNQPITSNDEVWMLDTTDLPVPVVDPDEVFIDGFESGDLSVWIDGPPPASLTYVAALELTNQIGVPPVTYEADSDETFTLTPLGDLGEPSLTALELGPASWRFTENSPNATEWRWEFWLDGSLQEALDWSDPDSNRVVEYVFTDNGDWEIRVFSSNCDNPNPPPGQNPATFEVMITVEPPNLQVQAFQGVSCGSTNCSIAACDCSVGQTATFKVFLAAGSDIPQFFEFDWTCEDDFTLEQTFSTPTQQPDGSYQFTHVYPTECTTSVSGNHKPQVQVKKDGVNSAVKDCQQTIVFP